ncbi:MULTISPECIES: hypothetical protein [Mycobacteriaceae]|uniref:hypothetical protein n=1 Tax=Mycobacteriaceae TaxID=1762 RepID=UPI0007FDCDD6|nr:MULTISPECIES: hypothetical protein [Mycobacteriaceae]MCK0176714.1 hypothetical protein [Mycolicibacterium sp. F2034L]OBB56048.1 hypothetical protein A5757_03190 [Mycobacterium sp. 852013-51886_SCH5428379]
MRRLVNMARAAVVATMIGAAAFGTAATAAASESGTLYGDPAGAAQYWAQQTEGDCVLMATADVIGQVTGDLPSEQDIIATASRTPSESHPGPIYTPDDPSDPDGGAGTNGADVPALLRAYGIESDYTDADRGGRDGNIDAGIDALEQYLGQGRKVIAIVDAWKIWNQEDDSDGSAHGLVVTGVDTGTGMVHLNDSGVENGADEQVSIDTFVAAWQIYDQTMIVTRT